MTKAIIIFAVNTLFLCLLRWEVGEAIADGLSLSGAAWDFVTHGVSVIYAGFLLGLLGSIAAWTRPKPLRRLPLALLLVTLLAMNWLLEDNLGSDPVSRIRERFILCLTITLSAALTVWPLRSRQISIMQAGWLTLFVAVGCAAARLQASYVALWGFSSGIMLGVVVGFIVAADMLFSSHGYHATCRRGGGAPDVRGKPRRAPRTCWMVGTDGDLRDHGRSCDTVSGRQREPQ